MKRLHIPGLTLSFLLSAGIASAQFYSMGSWSSSFFTAPSTEVPLTGDFNGDGVSDIIKFTRGASADVYVKLSDRSAFLVNLANPNATWFPWHFTFCPNSEVPLVGDFNGDGKDDIVSFRRGADPKVTVALSTGSAFSASSVWHNAFCGSTSTPGVGDFNGDGKDDIICFSQGVSGNVYVALSNGTNGFGATTLWHSDFAYSPEVPMTGDFNGDGKDDIIGFTRGSDADVFVALSNGSSFLSRISWHGFFCANSETPRVGDVNDDGKDDILTFTGGSAANVYVATSSGTAFTGTGSLWNGNFAGGTSIPHVGDFNGYGKADVVAFNPSVTGTNNVTVAVAEQSVSLGCNVEPWDSASQTVEYLELNDDKNTDYRYTDIVIRMHIVNSSGYPVEVESSTIFTDNSPGSLETDINTVINKTSSVKIYTSHFRYRYLNILRPLSITVQIKVKGVPNPVQNTYALRPYIGSNSPGVYLFPLKRSDLGDGEFWGWNGIHGGGQIQSFAYDIMAKRWSNSQNKWVNEYTESPPTSLEDYIAWNKPVYAMADGWVLDVAYDNEDNELNGPQIDDENYLAIQHGDTRVIYAHFRKNSILTKFRIPGSPVTKGEILGYIGFSGNTSKPHLHVHGYVTSGSDKLLRPIPFYGARTISASELVDPNFPFQNISDWQYMDNRGTPPSSCLIDELPQFYPSIPPNAPFTGVDETNTEESIQVYPNPTRDNITIISPFAPAGWEIATLSGQVVQSGTGNGFDKQITLDVQQLASGIYLLKLTGTSGEHAVQRFVRL